MNCQYCFLPYDDCTCCKFCGFLKGSCHCSDEGHDPCTKFHPSDAYKSFAMHSKFCEMFGMTDLSQVDKYVMSMYTKDVWPERLKKEEMGED